MKKKSFFILTSLLIFIFVFSGCADANSPKTFSKAGMSITLDGSFNEAVYESYTACYDSPYVAVYALKQDFTFFEGSGYGTDTPLKDYANLVIESNGLENCDVTEANGLVGFSFQKESGGGLYHYNAYVYKSDSAFWLVQFATEADNASVYENKIISFAQSVTFD